MNIHPAFVHFPIALLIVYAVLECVRPQCVMKPGGALVYGPDVDPIVSFIYHLFY